MAEPATAVEDDFELNVVGEPDGDDDDEPPPLPSPVPSSDGDWEADPSAAEDGDAAPPPATALQSSFRYSAFKDEVLPAAAERGDDNEPGADAVLPAAAQLSDDDELDPGADGGDEAAAGATRRSC